MNSEINIQMAQAHNEQRLREARARQGHGRRPHATLDDLRIRLAADGDAAALRRLGELEDRPVPAGRILVAEVGGEVRAALPLSGGEGLANPFRHTEHLMAALAEARARFRGEQDGGLLAAVRAAWRRGLRHERPATRPAGAPAVPGSESLLSR